MPSWVIDMVMTVLILGITYALISEGLWGAALMFFNILFAALIAFNFYETLAQLLADNAGGPMAIWADMLCLMGLFLISLIILRVMTESMAPGMVRFPMPLYHLGRLAFGLGGGLVTVAILLLAFETAPVHKKVFGVIDYNYQPPWKFGLDRRWLAFFQRTTGQIFARYGSGIGNPESEYGNTFAFDPRGSWLIDHQNARPFGDPSDTVPPPEAPPAPPADAGAGGGGAPGGGGPGGMQAPGMPGR